MVVGAGLNSQSWIQVCFNGCFAKTSVNRFEKRESKPGCIKQSKKKRIFYYIL